MNHKRRRPKKCRNGCLVCKPHKANGWSWAKRYPKLAAYANQDAKLAAYANQDAKEAKPDA